MRAAILCLGLLWCSAFAASNPPTPSGGRSVQKENGKIANANNQSASEPRGTASAPLFVQSLPALESAEEAAHKHYEHHQKPTLEWLMGWGTAWLAGFTLLLVIGTGVLAVFTFLLWREAGRSSVHQSRANRRSLNIARKSVNAATDSIALARSAYIADNRPWISVEAAVSTDLARNANGIEFGINFLLKNHGRSPAIDVFILYELVTLKPPYTDPWVETHKEIRARGFITKQMGVQIFPAGTEMIRWVNTLSNKEIDAGKNERSPQGMLPSVNVIGAAFYRTPFGDEIHETGFNYSVVDVGNPMYPRGSDLPDFTGALTMERIRLEPKSFSKGEIT